MHRAAALMLAILLPAAQAAGAAQSGPVTVYRCVDARGHVMLGDAPCPSGSKEEVRTMQRPQDAPRPVTPAVSALPQAPATPASVAPQVIVMRTPQPMYECTTPDGERYTSETGDGNPRWVPLWTLGYGGRHRIDASRGTARQADSIWQNVGASSPSRLSGASGGHRPSDRGRPPHYGYAQGGGTWIRDTCHALPPAEVCSRLVDRRDEIRRRFFNAQENERNELRREERGINARLAADCG